MKFVLLTKLVLACYTSTLDALKLHFSQADEKGEWKAADGQSRLDRFWEMHNKNPDLCLVQPKWAGTYPCPADKLSMEYVSPSLGPFDPHHFMKAISGKTVSFVGDSINSQLFETLVCSLSAVVTKDSVKVERPGYVETRHPDHGIHKITFPNNTVIQSVFWKAGDKDKSPNSVHDSDIVVMNVGAHLKDWKTLKSRITKAHKLVTSQVRPGAKLLWREYSPTHFHPSIVDYLESTETESYDKKKKKTHSDGVHTKYPECYENNQTAYERNKVNNFRRHTANALMSEMGWDIVHIWDIASMHTADMHLGRGDCRHWCQPSPVLDAFLRVLAKNIE